MNPLKNHRLFDFLAKHQGSNVPGKSEQKVNNLSKACGIPVPAKTAWHAPRAWNGTIANEPCKREEDIQIAYKGESFLISKSSELRAGLLKEACDLAMRPDETPMTDEQKIALFDAGLRLMGSRFW
jgi:hypothetical protein